jgi:four helix bundle protein
MTTLEHAKSFRDLVVYQKARAVACEIFRLTKGFPREEAFSLTNQIRRSSRSIGAQIAEAWAKRRYEAHFTSKLTDADAEQQETQHWLETALDCDYITQPQASQLNARLQEIGRMLHSMQDKADRFCNSGTTLLRDSAVAEYFVEAL